MGVLYFYPQKLSLSVCVCVCFPQKISLFSPEQVGQLFTFLARQIARKKQHIRVDSRMFDQVGASRAHTAQHTRGTPVFTLKHTVFHVYERLVLSG